MRKPCTTCKLAKAYDYGNRTVYEPCGGCWRNCEKRNKYETYKESQRKYKCGAPISSMNEFMWYIKENRYIFWHNKVYNVEVIKSWQYRMIEITISRGNFSRAILKKECENGNV